jgi:hypothetical protein
VAIKKGIAESGRESERNMGRENHETLGHQPHPSLAEGDFY